MRNILLITKHKSWRKPFFLIQTVLFLVLLNSAYLTIHAVEIVSLQPVESILALEIQQKSVKGRVVDNNGDPLVGVTITVVGTTRGVVTGNDGTYSIEATPTDKLAFSFIGMKKQEISVENQLTINVTLMEDSQQIEDVVVVGYGTQKKVNLTGAVSSVKMDEVIGNRPVTFATTALMGSVPGLVFSGFSGEPGSRYNINIRGTSSINGSQPLVLVDNVPMDLAYVNPEDIESVSVLKDASASAVYGARAAFGVILVTTKKSDKDRPNKFSYSTKISLSNPQELAKRASPLQTVQAMKDAGWKTLWVAGQDIDRWIELLNEYNANPSLYPDGYTRDKNIPYQLKETDVTRDMMANFGIQKIHDFSVSGGSSKSSYRISLGILDDDGILVTNKDKYTRNSVSAFLNTDVAKWLTTEVSLLYTNSKKSDPTDFTAARNMWSSSLFQPSFHPVGGMETDDGYKYFSTPRSLLEIAIPDVSKSDRMNLLGRVILKPIEGLNITGEYSLSNFFGSNTRFRKPIRNIIDGMTLDILPSNVTQSSYNEQKLKTVYNAMNLFATYSKAIQNHNFTLMAGINSEHNDDESLTANRIQMINDELPSIGQGVGLITANDGFSEYSLFGTFYRINYSFMDRYLIEASGRYDGSSKFPKSQRFGFFPSFSAGWRINEESFMDFLKDVISNLKLRASWGSIGNQNIDPFQYTPGMQSILANWLINDQKPTSLNPPALVRSNFTWEEVRTLNFGLDFGFFNQKLNGSFDIFNRETLNMLARGLEYPSIIGASAPLQNVADLESKGWELQISWKDKIENTSYSVGFHLSDNISKVKKFKNESKVLTDHYEGQVLGEIWGYETDRLYTVDDFVEGTLDDRLMGGTLKPGIAKFKGYNPNPGDVLFKNPDENGEVWQGADNTADNPGSRRIIGNSSPRYIFGFNADVSWKGFGLSILLQGTGKRQAWLRNVTMFPYTHNWMIGLYDYQLDYWTINNPNSFFPRIYASAAYNTEPNYQVQTRYLMNAAYLDIKSVVLSYDLNKSITSKLKMDKISFFLSGENLWSFNHYPEGVHPDNRTRSDGATYPFMRMFTGGLNISF